MLAWSTATLAVLLLVLGVVVFHPPGAVRQCRDAINLAREAGR